MKIRALVAGLGALLGLACATPIPAERLPEQPLAFVHRTPAQGRERAELLQKRRGKALSSGEGVLNLNEIDDLMEHFRGRQERVSPELQGQMALYYAREERVELLDAFVAGAIPCDWNEDHTRLLAASRQRGAPRLLEYSLERRDVGVGVVPSDFSVQIGGSYGPEGRIAYADARRAAEGLQISIRVTRPGGPDESLTPGPSDLEPRWSPDGKTVLFEGRLRNGAPVIKAIDVDDALAQPRVIARGREARFSPRGDWVVYSHERGEGWRLWRMRPDGSGKTAIGHAIQGQADERHPTVSPDGEFVAYVAEEGDREQIRIRGMDGTGDRILIERADGTLPVW